MNAMSFDPYTVPALPLSEPLYPKNKAYWRIFALLFSGGMLLVSPLLFLAWRDADSFCLGFALEVLIVLLPIMFVTAGSHRNYLSRKSGTVNFDGEIVTISNEIKKCTVPLKSCRYFYGSASWATLPGIKYFTVNYGNTLLLELPRNESSSCRNSPFLL